MPQTYSRYFGYDFERRWRTRLDTPLCPEVSQLHVVVTSRFPMPNRYGWELRPTTGLAVKESQIQFASWDEAGQAGKLALKQFAPGGHDA